MSSLVRTIQKKIAKAQGYVRQKQEIREIGGVPQIIRLKRGEGVIIGPDGESTRSYQWPQVSAPTNPDAPLPASRSARGRRRGQPSKRPTVIVAVPQPLAPKKPVLTVEQKRAPKKRSRAKKAVA